MYSAAAAGTAAVVITVRPDVQQYVIEVTRPTEYTVNVAGATRHGAGPVTSRTGEMLSVFVV